MAAFVPFLTYELAVCLRADGSGCAGQVGNPLLPGIKSKMLPDTDFTHQQYYEVGQTMAVHDLLTVWLPYAPFHEPPEGG